MTFAIEGHLALGWRGPGSPNAVHTSGAPESRVSIHIRLIHLGSSHSSRAFLVESSTDRAAYCFINHDLKQSHGRQPVSGALVTGSPY